MAAGNTHPVQGSKSSEPGLLADTRHLLPKHGMVLAADRAAKIPGSARKGRLDQGSGHDPRCRSIS